MAFAAHRSSRAIVIVIVSVLASGVAVPASAGGRLDPSFGGDGKVITTFARGYAAARGVELQPDGRIVVVGDSARSIGWISVARYEQDGDLDPTFGVGGKISTHLGRRKSLVAGFDAAIQPDGRIVVVGEADESAVVLRYLFDGTLDPSFGTGGAAAILGHRAFGVTLQPNGKILMVGGGFTTTLVARYTTHGELDPAFSDDGIDEVDVGCCGEGAHDIGLQANGRIVVAGWVEPTPGTPTYVALMRYRRDGRLDPTFGDAGIVTTLLPAHLAATALTIQPNGRIVVAGTWANGFMLARYLPRGSLDQSFGEGGMVRTGFGGELDAASDVALQDDGKIVAAGFCQRGFALARYHPDGTLDASFAGNGKRVTRFAMDAGASGMVIQPDGRIILAGESLRADGTGVFALARYLP